jgi:hypothetical protein
LLDALLVTSFKLNLCADVTTQSATDNICIIQHAQNTTALEPNISECGIHRLLVANKRQPPLSGSNYYQGQLQIPRSRTVFGRVRLSGCERRKMWGGG